MTWVKECMQRLTPPPEEKVMDRFPRAFRSAWPYWSLIFDLVFTHLWSSASAILEICSPLKSPNSLSPTHQLPSSSALFPLTIMHGPKGWSYRCATNLDSSPRPPDTGQRESKCHSEHKKVSFTRWPSGP